MDFTISSDQILAICAFITAIWGVAKIIKEIKKPSDDLKATVEKHTEYLANDDLRLKEIEASNKMVLKSLLVIINHDITNNGYDKLKEARNELQEFLIDK